jgi:hypothetical protein
MTEGDVSIESPIVQSRIINPASGLHDIPVAVIENQVVNRKTQSLVNKGTNIDPNVERP